MRELPVGLYRHRHSIASMGALALSGFVKKTTQPLAVGSVSGTLPRYDEALGAEFLRVTHGEPNGFVPPTFYVTWAMGALADALVKVGLPYDYSRVLHAASEVSYTRPLLQNEAARFEVHVASVDDNERRARIRVEGIVTQPDGAEIFRQAMELWVPKRGGSKRAGGQGGKKQGPVVDPDMHAIGALRLPKSIGRRYALVSGDFNPVHWSATAARLLGFKRSFVQGYCTKAMIAHMVLRNVGPQDRLQSLRVEFRKPILLPAQVSLFLGPGGKLAVGDAAGGEAFVTGQLHMR